MLFVVTIDVWVASGDIIFVYICSDADSVFSEAKAEVMRNSLPLCPCVGGGREEDRGGLVVESHWEVGVTVQRCHT